MVYFLLGVKFTLTSFWLPPILDKSLNDLRLLDGLGDSDLGASSIAGVAVELGIVVGISWVIPSAITYGLSYLPALRLDLIIPFLIIQDNNVWFISSLVNTIPSNSSNLPPAFSTLLDNLPENNRFIFMFTANFSFPFEGTLKGIEPLDNNQSSKCFLSCSFCAIDKPAKDTSLIP